MPPRNGQNPRRLAGEGTLEKLTTVSAEGARPTGRISQAKGQSDRAARRAVSGGFSGVAGTGRRLLFSQRGREETHYGSGIAVGTAHQLLSVGLYSGVPAHRYGSVLGVVEEEAVDVSIREEDKKFIIDFYKYAFVGFMIDWIKKGMKEQPEAFIEKLSVLIKGDIKRALDRFRTDK